MEYDLATVDGISAFIMKDYADVFKSNGHINEVYEHLSRYNPYVKEVNPDVSLTKMDFSHISFNDEVFDKLGVKYIVTDRDLYLTHHKKVFDQDNIAVYENLNVIPRAVIFDNKNQIIETPDIISVSPNQIKIHTINKGLLILRDTYYPGWHAFINGTETKVMPYDKIFRSISLNKPGGNVEFRFEPLSFKYGAAISAVSWLLILIYILKKLIIKSA